MSRTPPLEVSRTSPLEEPVSNIYIHIHNNPPHQRAMRRPSAMALSTYMSWLLKMSNVACIKGVLFGWWHVHLSRWVEWRELQLREEEPACGIPTGVFHWRDVRNVPLCPITAIIIRGADMFYLGQNAQAIGKLVLLLLLFPVLPIIDCLFICCFYRSDAAQVGHSVFLNILTTIFTGCRHMHVSHHRDIDGNCSACMDHCQLGHGRCSEYILLHTFWHFLLTEQGHRRKWNIARRGHFGVKTMVFVMGGSIYQRVIQQPMNQHFLEGTRCDWLAWVRFESNLLQLVRQQHHGVWDTVQDRFWL